MSVSFQEVRNDIQQIRNLAIDHEWLEDLRLRIDDLCAIAGDYLEPAQVERLREACQFAAEAHAGIYLKSGEPYIFHSLAVARILANVRFDHETLQAALLHDVIEDTQYNKEQISIRFGPEVADLVDGVSKLTQIQFNPKLEAQAENYRKMFLAIAKDLRVIMIKLADRLHNMRTLGTMRPESRRRIARETLDIYAPIAGRLGMNHLRQELENLGFSHLYPLRHRILQDAVRKMSGNRREIVSQLESRIQDRLHEEGINARVIGRSKHLWGIYKKMRLKCLPFREVQDVFGMRIIVSTTKDCYEVLGVMHALYKPIMGRFKDYIAIPKANGYQSLHTVLFGPNGVPIELLICTEEMYVMADVGVAAHWRYKSDDDSQGSHAQQQAREWLRKLLDMQRRAGGNPVEFLESVKVDLFPDEVYVFTPRGEIVQLPRGATVVDFAYAIHTDVGNTCVGAKIDRLLVPLRTPLATGQTVEAIITPTARPNPAWLNFVVTAKARTSIRYYLKHLQREEAVLLGKRLLERALSGWIKGLEELQAEQIKALVQELKLASFDDLLADIGLGNLVAALIAKRLMSGCKQEEAPSTDASTPPLLIKGAEGTVVGFGKCCWPLPGDAIVGYLNAGRGIVIHRNRCKNVANYKKNPEKWIEVEWEPQISADFSAELRLDVINKRGVLATIAAAISATDSNIEIIKTSERDGNTTTVHLLLNIRDRNHLARVMRRLRTLPEFLRVARIGEERHVNIDQEYDLTTEIKKIDNKLKKHQFGEIVEDFFIKANFEITDKSSYDYMLVIDNSINKKCLVFYYSKDKIDNLIAYINEIIEKNISSLKDFFPLYIISELSDNLDDIHRVRKEIKCELILINYNTLKSAIYDTLRTCRETLSFLEAPYLIRTDPYWESKPIYDPFWFYGRNDLLKKIPLLLAQKQHVGIFGIRKVGKTSLINQLKQHLDRQPVVFIDCQSINNYNSELLFQIILKQLNLQVKKLTSKKLKVSFNNINDYNFYEDIVELYRIWIESKIIDAPFIIILDEVDKLFPDIKIYDSEIKLKEYIHFFRVLRGLAQAENCLSILTVSYRSDINRRNFLGEKIGENPMFKSLYEQFLGYLTEKDSGKLIRGLGEWKDIIWEPDAVEKVFECCGGHPFITRLFASFIYNKNKEMRNIKKETVENHAMMVINTFITNEIGNYYKEGIWNLLHKNEQEVLFRIYKNRNSLITGEIEDNLEDAASNLINFGLINYAQNAYSINSSLFKEWLSRRASS